MSSQEGELLAAENEIKSFSSVKGIQDASKRGGKPDMPESDCTDLSSDDNTKEK